MPPFLMAWFWLMPCMSASLAAFWTVPATSGHADPNKRISGDL